jgi:hypothetical protein
MSDPAPLTLKGQRYDYEVGEYHLHVEFTAEDGLHWTYLSAPDGQTGKNSAETLDLVLPIRHEVMLIAWKEASGTQVIDVFDFEKMVLYANYVTADGERSFTQAKLRPAK